MPTAIETTGTIERGGKIVIDETFSVNVPTSVRVIVLFPDSDDVNENDWLQAASRSDPFDFLNDLDEDIYSHTDGKPLSDEI